MVSVVMAVYNGIRFLREQLDSIYNQTQKPDEVLFFDDGSTDGSVELILSYINEKQLKNWNVICNQGNKGYSKNFIEGAHQAKGDTIYFADQDDIWDVTKIQKCEKLFLEYPKATMIESNYRFVDENGQYLQNQDNYHKLSTNKEIVKLTTSDMCRFAGSGFTMAFRRSVDDFIYIHKLNNDIDLFVFHDVLCGLVAEMLGDVYLDFQIEDLHRLHNNNATKKQGKSYLESRSKKKQLEILDHRRRYFQLMNSLCVENTEKRDIFREFEKFSDTRRQLIVRFSILKYMYLIRHRHMYYSHWGVLADLLYSLGFEKELMKIYQYIRV